jgi:hypothetical protein
MSYEEVSDREVRAFAELTEAVTERSHLDARMAVFSQHREPYEVLVKRLLAAVQAYEQASSDLLAIGEGRQA